MKLEFDESEIQGFQVLCVIIVMVLGLSFGITKCVDMQLAEFQIEKDKK